MDSSAEKPSETSSLADQTAVSRIPVLGVVLAAAIALGSASVMSGYAMGGPPLFATLTAVGGAVVWWYAPRVGYWVLLADGLVTMAASGVALAQGAVPWVLVAFWGGSAVLLAAILHLTTGAGRSGTVTLVAVISLLVLSALGLTQYVSATWAPNERVILERLPAQSRPGATSPEWITAVSPAPEGAWHCAWSASATPTEALRAVRAALVADGWSIRGFSASGLSAEKTGDRLEVILAEDSGANPAGPTGYGAAGVELIATVQRTAPASTP